MKIKKLEYENFRNFKDPGAIVCSTDGKVTIIYGDTGEGKTTLHQLFQWIIYGVTHFNKTASDKMYNLDKEKEAPLNSKFIVKGTIDFEHDGKDYSMTREWVYRKEIFDSKRISDEFSIMLKDDLNNWKKVLNPSDFVEQILPSGLAEYFFFDGENMIADLKVKGKDSAGSLRKTMYMMLDLSIYDRALTYIGSKDQKTTVLGSLFMSKTDTNSDSALSDLGDKMADAQTRRDELDKNINDLTEENKRLRERVNQISEQIGSTKSKKEYEQNRKDSIKRRDEYLEDANKAYENFGEELISIFPKSMMSKSIEKASNKIKNQASSSNLIQGVNKELIDALLQGDTCVCGRPLHDGEKEELKNLYNYLPPLGYDSLYRNFTDMAAVWGKQYRKDRLEGFIKDATGYLERARKEDETIKQIDEEIKSNKQYEGLATERTTAESKIDDNNSAISGFNEQLGKIKSLIRKLTREIDKASAASAQDTLIEKKIKVMEQIKGDFEKLLEDKSEEYSKKLQQNIQELLDRMLVARRTVNVSKDFSLRVVDSHDDESKSEGQFATVSFAYIGGIFKLLRDEKMISVKEYPLVLDAPFAKLGNGPRQNVINTIPEYAPQIILFSKDDLQDCFGEDKIGNVYTIVTNEEQNVATVKEGFLWK